MSATAIATPPEPPMAQEAAQTLAQSRALVVRDEQSYTAAWEYIQGYTKLERSITAFFRGTDGKPGPLVLAYRAYQSLLEKEGALIKPIKAEIARLKGDRSTWRQEQERQRRIEEARIAEEERKRREALALEEAVVLEQQGQRELASAVVEQVTTAPTPFIPLPDTTPKNEGSSVAPKWKFRIVNEAFVPRKYCVVDPKKVRKVVDALGLAADIPGVEVYPSDVERVTLR